MNKKKSNRTFWILFSLVIILYAGFSVYIYSNHSELKPNEVGDTFNIVTSLFAALGTLLIIYTIKMQQEELGLQREELEYTRVEFEIKRMNDVIWQLTQKVMSDFETDKSLKALRKVYVDPHKTSTTIEIYEPRKAALDQVIKRVTGENIVEKDIQKEYASIIDCMVINEQNISRAVALIELFLSQKHNHLNKLKRSSNKILLENAEYQYDVLHNIIVNNLPPALFRKKANGIWSRILKNEKTEGVHLIWELAMLDNLNKLSEFSKKKPTI